MADLTQTTFSYAVSSMKTCDYGWFRISLKFVPMGPIDYMHLLDNGLAPTRRLAIILIYDDLVQSSKFSSLGINQLNKGGDRCIFVVLWGWFISVKTNCYSLVHGWTQIARNILCHFPCGNKDANHANEYVLLLTHSSLVTHIWVK